MRHPIGFRLIRKMRYLDAADLGAQPVDDSRFDSLDIERRRWRKPLTEPRTV
jgi:hypothetical protein